MAITSIVGMALPAFAEDTSEKDQPASTSSLAGADQAPDASSPANPSTGQEDARRAFPDPVESPNREKTLANQRGEHRVCAQSGAGCSSEAPPPSTGADLAAIAPEGTAEAAPTPKSTEEEKAAKKRKETAELCELLIAAADKHAVPHDFFIRLIWKESRFNSGAVSPVGAQGIAQFMPGTARIRGLKNPFDREEALYASAHFLADLKARFGSWGLAAAGYNGGPNRIPRFVAGEGGLPYETIDYVFSITGRTAKYWAQRARQARGKGNNELEATGEDASALDGDPASAEGVEETALSAASQSPKTEETRAQSGVSNSAETLVEAEEMEDGDTPGDGGSAMAETGEIAQNPPAPWRRLGDLTLLTPQTRGIVKEIPKDALPRPPLARPDYTPPLVDCPKLVARLGQARSIAPPSGGGWTRWGAQVAGHPKRAVAMRQYSRLKARLPADLVAKGPTVVVRRFAARGRRAIHAVQFAAPNRSAAQALCKRIAKSLAPCVVVKNS